MKILIKFLLIFTLMIVYATSAFTQQAIFDSYMQSGDNAMQRGDYVEAEKLFRLAISEIGDYESGRFAESSDAVIRLSQALNALGGALYRQKKSADAERVYQKQIKLMEAAGLTEDALFTNGLNNLGLIMAEQKRYSEAEVIHRRALSLRENIEGAMHPDVAASLSNLGKVYFDQGRIKEAEAMFLRASEIILKTNSESRFSVDSQLILATALGNLGIISVQDKRYAEAERLFKYAIAITEQHGNKSQIDLIIWLDKYGKLLRLMKRPVEAARLEARIQRIKVGGR